MATGVPARLSSAEARKFGFLVGGGFLVLAAVAKLRHHPGAVLWLAALGGVLVVLGAARPSWLKPVNRAWLAFGHGMSRVTTPILMGLIFFAVIAPTGLMLRLVGKNPIPSRGPRRGRWVPRARAADPRTAMQRQF